MLAYEKVVCIIFFFKSTSIELEAKYCRIRVSNTVLVLSKLKK